MPARTRTASRRAPVDVVVSGLVLKFLPDPVGAVGRWRGRPGWHGRGYVWDYASGMQLLRSFWDVAGALDPAVADLHKGHRFPISTTAALCEIWTAAGIAEVETTSLHRAHGLHRLR